MTATLAGAAAGPPVDALVAAAGGPDASPDGLIPLEAAPPSVSLISSATDVTTALGGPDGRWLNGIVFDPEVKAVSLTGDFPYWWTCPESGGGLATVFSPSGVKQVPDKPPNVTVRALTAHVADPCQTSHHREGKYGDEARAKRAVEANFPRIVENELWTAERARMAGFANPGLMRDVTATLNAGVAMGYLSALAELEEALGDGDNRDGMIHATRRLVSLWVAEQVVFPSATGKQLKTALGTTVVPGEGYPGTGPLLPAVNESRTNTFAYATGPVVYARSAAYTVKEFDRSVNDQIIRGEIDFMVFWDKKVDAVARVDLLNRLS